MDPISAVLGIAGLVLSASQAKALKDKEDLATADALAREEKILENTRVQGASAKFAAGIGSRDTQSTLDFLNPLAIGA